MAEHEKHVCQVLQQLLKKWLFVKGEKSEFHIQLVAFLVFTVEKGQLRADPAKIKVVVEWPAPQTQNQLQRFLGFANFYRGFI